MAWQPPKSDTLVSSPAQSSPAQTGWTPPASDMIDDRSTSRYVGDVGASFASGVPRAAGGLVSIGSAVPGLHYVADPLAKGLYSSADFLDENLLSDYQKNQNQAFTTAVQEAATQLGPDAGVGDYVNYIASQGGAAAQFLYDNPSQVPTLVASTLPMLFGGGLAGKGVQVAAKAAGRPISGLKQAAYGEGLMAGGMATGEIVQGLEEKGVEGWHPGRLAGIPAGAFTAGVGAVGGKILGASDVEQMLVGGAAKAPGLSGSLPARVLKGAGTEAAEEFVQGGGESVFTNLGTGDPLYEGVGAEMVAGSVAGSALGGFAGAFKFNRDSALQGNAPANQSPFLAPEQGSFPIATAASGAPVAPPPVPPTESSAPPIAAINPADGTPFTEEGDAVILPDETPAPVEPPVEPPVEAPVTAPVASPDAQPTLTMPTQPQTPEAARSPDLPFVYDTPTEPEEAPQAAPPPVTTTVKEPKRKPKTPERTEPYVNPDYASPDVQAVADDAQRVINIATGVERSPTQDDGDIPVYRDVAAERATVAADAISGEASARLNAQPSKAPTVEEIDAKYEQVPVTEDDRRESRTAKDGKEPKKNLKKYKLKNGRGATVLLDRKKIGDDTARLAMEVLSQYKNLPENFHVFLQPTRKGERKDGRTTTYGTAFGTRSTPHIPGLHRRVEIYLDPLTSKSSKRKDAKRALEETIAHEIAVHAMQNLTAGVQAEWQGSQDFWYEVYKANKDEIIKFFEAIPGKSGYVRYAKNKSGNPRLRQYYHGLAAEEWMAHALEAEISEIAEGKRQNFSQAMVRYFRQMAAYLSDLTGRKYTPAQVKEIMIEQAEDIFFGDKEANGKMDNLALRYAKKKWTKPEYPILDDFRAAADEHIDDQSFVNASQEAFNIQQGEWPTPRRIKQRFVRAWGKTEIAAHLDSVNSILWGKDSKESFKRGLVTEEQALKNFKDNVAFVYKEIHKYASKDNNLEVIYEKPDAVRNKKTGPGEMARSTVYIKVRRKDKPEHVWNFRVSDHAGDLGTDFREGKGPHVDFPNATLTRFNKDWKGRVQVAFEAINDDAVVGVSGIEAAMTLPINDGFVIQMRDPKTKSTDYAGKTIYHWARDDRLKELTEDHGHLRFVRPDVLVPLRMSRVLRLSKNNTTYPLGSITYSDIYHGRVEGFPLELFKEKYLPEIGESITLPEPQLDVDTEITRASMESASFDMEDGFADGKHKDMPELSKTDLRKAVEKLHKNPEHIKMWHQVAGWINDGDFFLEGEAIDDFEDTGSYGASMKERDRYLEDMYDTLYDLGLVKKDKDGIEYVTAIRIEGYFTEGYDSDNELAAFSLFPEWAMTKTQSPQGGMADPTVRHPTMPTQSALIRRIPISEIAAFGEWAEGEIVVHTGGLTKLSKDINQEYDSAATSRKQAASLLKKGELFEEGTRNLDLGGGKFDLGVAAMAKHGVESRVMDEFNRTEEHNESVQKWVDDNPVDTVTVANVLNVIKEEDARAGVIQTAYDALKDGGEAYFQVYYDSKKQAGVTKDGWQNHKPIKDYLPEVQEIFPDAYLKTVGGIRIIVAPKTGAVAKESTTEEITKGSIFRKPKQRSNAGAQARRAKKQMYKAVKADRARMRDIGDTGVVKNLDPQEQAEAAKQSTERDDRSDYDKNWGTPETFGDIAWWQALNPLTGMRGELIPESVKIAWAAKFEAINNSLIDWSANTAWAPNIDLHGLSITGLAGLKGRKEYLRKRYLMMGKIAQVDKMAKRIYDTLGKAGPEYQAPIFEFLNGVYTATDLQNQGVPQSAIDAAVELRKQINDNAERLIKQKMLRRDTVEQNPNYLPRMYLKYVLSDSDHKVLSGGGSVSAANYLKGRKLRKAGDKVATDKVIDPETGTEYKDYRVAAKKTGKKVSETKEWDRVFKEVTEKEAEHDQKVAEFLGEIQDPGFLGASSISNVGRDVALMEFLEELSQDGNHDWMLDHNTVAISLQRTADGSVKVSAVKGASHTKKYTTAWLRHEAQAMRERARSNAATEEQAANLRDMADQMEAIAEDADQRVVDQKTLRRYRQVPDSPKYGKLAGAWIDKRIYNDLFSQTNTGAGNKYWRTAEQIHGMWKTAKVPLNPPTIARNIMSNMVLQTLDGMPVHRVFEYNFRAMNAIWKHRGIINGDVKGEFTGDFAKAMEIAQKYGIEMQTFTTQEMSVIRKKFKARARQDKGWKKNLFYMTDLAGSGLGKATGFYGKVETTMKVALIQYHLDQQAAQGGTTDGEFKAFMRAQETLFDYSLLNKGAKAFRKAPVGAPFLSFALLSTRRLGQVVTTNPLRMLAWYLAAQSIWALSASQFEVDEDDLEDLHKALPEYLASKPNALLLPMPGRDANGRLQFYDFSYTHPFGIHWEMFKNFSQGEIDELMETMGITGAPMIQMAIAMSTGVDPFTKQDITNENFTLSRKTWDRFGFLWRQAMPSLITSQGAFYKMYESATGKVGASKLNYGEAKYSMGQAMLRLAGINTYPVDPESTALKNVKVMRYKMSDLDAGYKKLIRDPNLSDSEREKLITEYRMQRLALVVDIQEMLKLADVHPNLKIKDIKD